MVQRQHQKPARTGRWFAGWTIIAGGLLLLAQGLYLPAKAQVAQWLLGQAWAKTEADGGQHSPWPWADGHPVARLRWPAGGVSQIVLSSASARAMAFGPNHVGASALPGARGHVVVNAHRDTHFAFLGKLAAGDQLVLEHPSGQRWYRVFSRQVVDLEHQAIQLSPEADLLTLVTCWPLNALTAGGTQRLLVHLRPETQA
ncbi:MAG: class GN sortase [Pseudomonadota bacterium]